MLLTLSNNSTFAGMLHASLRGHVKERPQPLARFQIHPFTRRMSEPQPLTNSERTASTAWPKLCCRARANAGGRMNTHVLSSPQHSVGPFDVSIRGGAPQLQNNLGSSLVHNLLESHASVSPSHKASLRRCRTLRRCSQLHDASCRVLLDDTRKVTLPRGVKDDAVCATFTARRPVFVDVRKKVCRFPLANIESPPNLLNSPICTQTTPPARRRFFFAESHVIVVVFAVIVCRDHAAQA